jgi:hypothetical protein
MLNPDFRDILSSFGADAAVRLGDPEICRKRSRTFELATASMTA